MASAKELFDKEYKKESKRKPSRHRKLSEPSVLKIMQEYSINGYKRLDGSYLLNQLIDGKSFDNSFGNHPPPNIGDEIVGYYLDKDRCGAFIYTWKKKNNPKELQAWDYPKLGTTRFVPCKKHTNKKFKVICTNCCN